MCQLSSWYCLSWKIKFPFFSVNRFPLSRPVCRCFLLKVGCGRPNNRAIAQASAHRGRARAYDGAKKEKKQNEHQRNAAKSKAHCMWWPWIVEWDRRRQVAEGAFPWPAWYNYDVFHFWIASLPPASGKERPPEEEASLQPDRQGRRTRHMATHSLQAALQEHKRNPANPAREEKAATRRFQVVLQLRERVRVTHCQMRSSAGESSISEWCVIEFWKGAMCADGGWICGNTV